MKFVIPRTFLILGIVGNNWILEVNGLDFNYSSVSGHLLNLADLSSNPCIGHVHSSGDAPRDKYSIAVTIDEKSDCFVVYNEPRCTGAHLKFQNVGVFKQLGFDRKTLKIEKREVLMNFQIAPKSFSRCLPEFHSGECWSDYRIRIGEGDGKAVTEECMNIRNFSTADFEANIGTIYLDLDDHDYSSDPQVCIETYSQKGCAGEMVQYTISGKLTPTDRKITQRSIKLWQFYSNHNFRAIDIDIKSVRKCLCKPYPEAGNNPIMESESFNETTTADSSKVGARITYNADLSITHSVAEKFGDPSFVTASTSSLNETEEEGIQLGNFSLNSKRKTEELGKNYPKGITLMLTGVVAFIIVTSVITIRLHVRL